MKKKSAAKGLRPEKKSVIEEFRGHVRGSGYLLLADYKGLTAAKSVELRRRLRGAQAKMQVVRNRLFSRVAADEGYPGLEAQLAGPTALFFGQGDVAQVAKILKDFKKEHERFALKGGALAGAMLSAADVEQLAGLPSRDVMRAVVVGTIAAPMARLVGVLSQKLASVVYVLKAVEEKKAKANG